MLSADYIIVGGGLTGIALAVRLSEVPTLTVTVLEAGGDKFHDENLDTPGNLATNVNMKKLIDSAKPTLSTTSETLRKIGRSSAHLKNIWLAVPCSFLGE